MVMVMIIIIGISRDLTGLVLARMTVRISSIRDRTYLLPRDIPGHLKKREIQSNICIILTPVSNTDCLYLASIIHPQL